jgi:hypothetical protein
MTNREIGIRRHKQAGAALATRFIDCDPIREAAGRSHAPVRFIGLEFRRPILCFRLGRRAGRLKLSTGWKPGRGPLAI